MSEPLRLRAMTTEEEQAPGVSFAHNVFAPARGVGLTHVECTAHAR